MLASALQIGFGFFVWVLRIPVAHTANVLCTSACLHTPARLLCGQQPPHRAHAAAYTWLHFFRSSTRPFGFVRARPSLLFAWATEWSRSCCNRAIAVFSPQRCVRRQTHWRHPVGTPWIKLRMRMICNRLKNSALLEKDEPCQWAAARRWGAASAGRHNKALPPSSALECERRTVAKALSVVPTARAHAPRALSPTVGSNIVRVCLFALTLRQAKAHTFGPSATRSRHYARSLVQPHRR